jgi:hypothetical protein
VSQIGRVDQAILLLKERLRRLGERKSKSVHGNAAAARPESESRLEPIRQLARQRDIGERDLRRAMVRTLLADALGEQLATSLEFEAITARVTTLLEDSEAGIDLLDRALAELD